VAQDEQLMLSIFSISSSLQAVQTAGQFKQLIYYLSLSTYKNCEAVHPKLLEVAWIHFPFIERNPGMHCKHCSCPETESKVQAEQSEEQSTQVKALAVLSSSEN